MIYVHDTIKFRPLVKLPISFQIYLHTKDKWLFNFIHILITIYSSELIIIIYDSDSKVFKVFNKIKKKKLLKRQKQRDGI